jgi:diguanylate cyclase (GGDEF)-like protein
MERHTQSVLGKVSVQLSKLERRDWELWAVVSFTGLLLGAGLLAVLFPAFYLGKDSFHVELTVPRPLVLGLTALIALLNTYLLTKRMEVRKLREELISSTLQHELTKQQSFTDPLTEIYNRHSLDEMAGRYISYARRTKKPLTMLLVDIDRFREVNTKFGHLTGDFVLADAASLLKAAVRGSDAVFRYGGDEFIVILGDTGLQGAAQVIARIHACTNEWNKAGHLAGFELALSVGAAEWKDGMSIDELMDTADRQMYEVKGTHQKALSASSGA